MKLQHNFTDAKRIKFGFILVLMIAFLSACDMDGSSNYTPLVVMAKKAYVSGGDTLNYSCSSAGLVLDTTYVGDTVNFSFYLEAYTNNLTVMSIEQSADSVSRIYWHQKSDLDKYITSQSDYKKGLFYMNAGISNFYILFKYIPTKASKTAKLSVTAVSDAKFTDSFGAGNSSTFTIIVPVKDSLSVN